MQRVDFAKNELEKLSESWTWNDSKLRLAGIGTPKTLISNIMSSGTYEPYVPLSSIRKNKIKPFEELLAGVDDDIGLFDEENQQVLELAGNI